MLFSFVLFYCDCSLDSVVRLVDPLDHGPFNIDELEAGDRLNDMDKFVLYDWDDLLPLMHSGSWLQFPIRLEAWRKSRHKMSSV